MRNAAKSRRGADSSPPIVVQTNNNTQNQTIMPSRVIPDNTDASYRRYVDSVMFSQ
jgi:hypothetical protein